VKKMLSARKRSASKEGLLVSGQAIDLDTLWAVADRARARTRLDPEDVSFIRDVVPDQFDSFPKLKLPAKIRHPAGFPISGAPVGTFFRGALLVAGQKALGRRFAGSEFYERVEQDLALRIMRSHFHHGYPKGAHCCVQCTLAVIPVLEAGAIRYFDCRKLFQAVRLLIRQRKWRFAGPVDPRMMSWAVGER
jgi:hypothetical protein